jgi:hypothetical protein
VSLSRMWQVACICSTLLVSAAASMSAYDQAPLSEAMCHPLHKLPDAAVVLWLLPPRGSWCISDGVGAS